MIVWLPGYSPGLKHVVFKPTPQITCLGLISQREHRKMVYHAL